MTRIVEQPADLVEPEAKRPPAEDLLEALEIVLGVQPVA
jgi:hypothetical protein